MTAAADDDDDKPVELAVLHAFPGIDVVESINQARHEHGGPPAPLSEVTINFEVRDARAHSISVKKLEIVFSNCGPKQKREKTDVKPLKITGHELYTWDDVDPIAKGAASVSTPSGGPKRYSVQATFDGITTYSACAFAIDLVVDRVRKKIELPLTIKRFEPLRR